MIKALIKGNIADLDGSGIVTVAVNAFNNIDSDRDISLPGSFTKTIKENFYRVKWLFNHNRDILLGVPLEAMETKDFLLVRGQLNMDKQVSRDVYSDYKLYAEHGLTLEHSIGVDPIDYYIDKENNVRKVKQWKLWEYSTLSTWGANENTPMIQMKGMNSLAQDAALMELKLHKGNYSDETFLEIEQSLKRLKSLLSADLKQKALQPVSADVLAGVSAQILKSLTT